MLGLERGPNRVKAKGRVCLEKVKEGRELASADAEGRMIVGTGIGLSCMML